MSEHSGFSPGLPRIEKKDAGKDRSNEPRMGWGGVAGYVCV